MTEPLTMWGEPLSEGIPHRERFGHALDIAFGDRFSNELGMMGLLVAAVRAHNLLAIPARER